MGIRIKQVRYQRGSEVAYSNSFSAMLLHLSSVVLAAVCAYAPVPSRPSTALTLKTLFHMLPCNSDVRWI